MFNHHEVTRRIAVLGLFLAVFSHYFAASAVAQVASPNVLVDATPKELLVGDTVTITFRVFSHEDEPITLDHKISLQIRDQKPGQECTTTDGTLLGDGVISGYCTSTAEPGKMEIWAKTDAEVWSTYKLNGVDYSSHLSAQYTAEFRDPKEFCAAGPVAPGSVVLLKQNDVAVKVEWQHVEKFLGTYAVLYGTKYGEYPHKRQTLDKSLIVDGLDPRQTYFITVQAQSTCKWSASSPVMQYLPLTGAVSVAKQITPPKTITKSKVVTGEQLSISASPTATASDILEVVAPSVVPVAVSEEDIVPPKELSRSQWLLHAVSNFFQKLKFW